MRDRLAGCGRPDRRTGEECRNRLTVPTVAIRWALGAARSIVLASHQDPKRVATVKKSRLRHARWRSPTGGRQRMNLTPRTNGGLLGRSRALMASAAIA